MPANRTRQRLTVALGCVAIIFVILAARLVKIQVIDRQRYKEMAVNQQTKDIPIPARRGEILDRNHRKLAVNMTLYNLWGDANRIASPETTSKLLSEALDVEPEALLEKIRDGEGLVSLSKWLSKETLEEVNALQLEGVWSTKVEKRHYPLEDTGAFIVGHTTNDNRGLAGIELEFNRYLTGLSGRWIRNTDAEGRQLPFGTDKYYGAQDGLDIVLTIDEVLQYYTEQIVEKGRTDLEAKRVMAVVMDPRNGDVLSMAVYPDYNPNEPRIPLDNDQKAFYDGLEEAEKQAFWNQMWRNPLVSDTYEPGSTFKVITSAMALEENVSRPDTLYYANGYIKIAGQVIKCWRHYQPHGEQTLTMALENSCNPVFVQLSEKIGKEAFYRYLEAFGFHEKTGIELPGESSGLLIPENRAGPVELATMSFGHGLSVTPMQLITAVSAIANDGRLMTPRLVLGFADEAGEMVETFEPIFKRQVVSKNTSMEVRLMMESVVYNGSGKEAYIPGFRVGGKTGTAEKLVDGAYDADRVVASFVAVAPVDEPRLAVLTVVDEPQKSHFGSQTAAPLAREILEKSLVHLAVDPTYTQEEMEDMNAERVSVPDLAGERLDEAVKMLEALGLDWRIEPEVNSLDEERQVVEQYPYAGFSARKGYSVLLYVE